MIFIRLTLLSMIFFAVAVCFGQVPSPEPDLYRNEHLGFEITLPKGWRTPEEAEKAAVTSMGIERLKTGNKRTDTALDYSVAREVQLIFVTNKPIGAVGNAAFGMSTQKQPSALVTPKMVVESGKSVFTANSVYKLVRDTSLLTLAGKQFAYIDLDTQINGQTIHLRYLVTMIQENALAVSISYNDDEDLELSIAALKTIKFFKK